MSVLEDVFEKLISGSISVSPRSPMNIFTSSERLAYAACFGVISNLVFKVIVDEKQAVDYTGPLYGERNSALQLSLFWTWFFLK